MLYPNPQEPVIEFCSKMEVKISPLSERYSLVTPYRQLLALFMLVLFLSVPRDPCLSMIISQSSILVKNILTMWLRTYSLISPFSVIWSPILFRRIFLLLSLSKRTLLETLSYLFLISEWIVRGILNPGIILWQVCLVCISLSCISMRNLSLLIVANTNLLYLICPCLTLLLLQW